jgi:hypothetical protein
VFRFAVASGLPLIVIVSVDLTASIGGHGLTANISIYNTPEPWQLPHLKSRVVRWVAACRASQKP